MLLPVRHLTHHRLPGGKTEEGGVQDLVSTATAVRCSQMTLPPSFSAESEMEGWVEGGMVQRGKINREKGGTAEKAHRENREP